MYVIVCHVLATVQVSGWSNLYASRIATIPVPCGPRSVAFVLRACRARGAVRKEDDQQILHLLLQVPNQHEPLVRGSGCG